jgi:hypothetical protein
MFAWNQHWIFENEIFETTLLFDPNLKFLFRHMFFVQGMEIVSCRLGCLILTIYTMMSLLGTSLLIPFSWILHMVLLSSSLPLQN